MNIAIPTINATTAHFEQNLVDIQAALTAVDTAFSRTTALLLHPYALTGAQPFDELRHRLFEQATHATFTKLAQGYEQAIISLMYHEEAWLVCYSDASGIGQVAFNALGYAVHAGFGITTDQSVFEHDLSQFSDPAVKVWVVFVLEPYSKEMSERVVQRMREFVQQTGQPVVVVGALGCANDLLFAGDVGFFIDQERWGYGFALENQVTLLELGALEPQVQWQGRATIDILEPLMQRTYAFICFAIKDFVHKSGFEQVHLGLSGGVDSALVATLAVLALGAQNVHAFLLPSPHSSEHSISDAKALAENLNIRYSVVEIADTYHQLQQHLGEHFPLSQLADENIQARLRGLYLMAYANSSKSLLLTTGNKSEIACGYSTLYGDMCGVYNPIGDLYKSEVYELCRYINTQAAQELIPNHILTKAPSAELRAGQFDQESLPEYERLDKIIELLLAAKYTYDEVVSLSGTSLEEVQLTARLLLGSEFKRMQSAPVLKLSDTHFGGRSVNVLSKFRGE